MAKKTRKNGKNPFRHRKRLPPRACASIEEIYDTIESLMSMADFNRQVLNESLRCYAEELTDEYMIAESATYYIDKVHFKAVARNLRACHAAKVGEDHTKVGMKEHDFYVPLPEKFWVQTMEVFLTDPVESLLTEKFDFGFDTCP